MSILPAAGYLSDGSRTEGEEKTAFEDLRDVVSELLGGSAETELTISSGSITPIGGAHRVDTEADAATDFLTHINYSNHPDGRYLIIHPENATRVVTITHGAGGDGQILLRGSADLTLFNTDSYLLLQRIGTTWVEITRFAPSGWNLIQSQDASNSASIEFTTGISSAYKAYVIEIIDLVPQTDNTELRLRVSQDAGSTWKSGASDYLWGFRTCSSGAAGSDAGSSGDTEITISTGISNANPARSFQANIWFYNPAGTVRSKYCLFDVSLANNSGVYVRLFGGGMFNLNQNAVNGFQLSMSSGNITSATIKLYGVCPT